MRSIRAVATVAALVTALPAFAAAQPGRPFKDAWFWGGKLGGLTYADSGGNLRQAPFIGLEMLITRTHGGLYVAASQSFLKTQTVFAANPAAPDTNFRAIDLQNMRRVDVAIMGFPGTHILVHPYVGAGFTMAQVPTASGQGPFRNQTEFNSTQALIEATRVAFSPLLMAGAQKRLKTMSVFGQLTIVPIQKNFILYNGTGMSLSYEVGVRYNIGTSIAKD